MYAILNRLNTTAVRLAIMALLLAAGFVTVFVVCSFIVPFVVSAIASAVATVVSVVVSVSSVIAHSAVYAATMLLWCAVRGAIIVALCKALPWLYVRREGLAIAARALAWCAVCVTVFVGAILVAPMVLAIAGKALVASSIVVSAMLAGKVI